MHLWAWHPFRFLSVRSLSVTNRLFSEPPTVSWRKRHRAFAEVFHFFAELKISPFCETPNNVTISGQMTKLEPLRSF